MAEHRPSVGLGRFPLSETDFRDIPFTLAAPFNIGHGSLLVLPVLPGKPGGGRRLPSKLGRCGAFRAIPRLQVPRSPGGMRPNAQSRRDGAFRPAGIVPRPGTAEHPRRKDLNTDPADLIPCVVRMPNRCGAGRPMQPRSRSACTSCRADAKPLRGGPSNATAGRGAGMPRFARRSAGAAGRRPYRARSADATPPVLHQNDQMAWRRWSCMGFWARLRWDGRVPKGSLAA